MKAGSILEGKEYFDSAFFRYRPDEAKVMDPQMRIFHECVWEAIEDAGCDPGDKKNKIGLFAGGSDNFTWQAYWALMNQDELVDSFSAAQLSDIRYLTTRISYALGLEGPSLFLDTACSTSLVAIHMACRSLLLAECHIGIAGGVTLSNQSKRGYLYRDGMILSKDGHCRAFDASSSGTVNGEGAAVIVLKTLKNALRDRDNIWAVIKGSAINNDGNVKAGYTVPSVDGQAEAILAAQKWAKVEPESIGYIEANAIGSRLGDPIEVASLNRVFGPGANKYCALGSVKTNIGHLNPAAGGAGFIKAVLSLRNRQIPPSLHFANPNPEIAFDGSPFYVNTELKEWTAGKYPLRAGVSSFGIGGTNAHIILEEAPRREEAPPREDVGTVRDSQLFLYSARSAAALKRNIARQLDYLEETAGERPLADIAYTLETGRVHFPYRHMLVAGSKEEAIDLLKLAASIDESALTSTPDRTPRLIFMFPGQGSQYAGMCRDLYEQENSFKRQVDFCCELVKHRFKKDLLPVLFPKDGEESFIDEAEFTQPGLFIVEYALAQLLLSWGIKPDVMIGHGMGEYAAACISGALSVENALSQLVKPGELMQKTPEGQSVSDETVRFSEGIGKHFLYPRSIFIEVGPGKVLSSLLSFHRKKLPGHAVVSLVKRPQEKGSDTRHLLQGLGELWKNGVTIDWQAYYSAEQRWKLSLPAYAFEKTTYQTRAKIDELLAGTSFRNVPRTEELKTANGGGATEVLPETGMTNEQSHVPPSTETEEKLLEIWSEVLKVDKEMISMTSGFFELGGHSIKAMAVANKIEKELNMMIDVRDIFRNATIRKLADFIKVQEWITGGNASRTGEKVETTLI